MSRRSVLYRAATAVSGQFPWFASSTRRASSEGGATAASNTARIRSLEGVATAAKRYLNAGQDEHLHAILLKALQRADLVKQEAGLEAAASDIGG